jgi:hypothetical protein
LTRHYALFSSDRDIFSDLPFVDYELATNISLLRINYEFFSTITALLSAKNAVNKGIDGILIFLIRVIVTPARVEPATF